MKFGKSLTVEAFKAMQGADTLQVYHNPKTDKLAVSCDGITVAAVSTKYDPAGDNKAFVEMIDTETGETLWCLCNRNEQNVIETL